MEEKIFLQLIKAVIIGKNTEKLGWKEEAAKCDPHKVYEIICRHKLQSFLCTVFISYLESCIGLDEDRREELEALADNVSREARVQITANYYLWHETDRIIKALKKDGIDAVVMKGPVAGMLYPEPECRKSGDIDIWIPAADRKGSAKLHSLGNEFDRASEILEKIGYIEDKDEESNYHMGFKGQAGLEVELHGRLMREIDSKVTEGVIDSFSHDAAEHIREVEVFEGFSIPGFSGAYLGVYLFLHMIHHFVGGGFGYRLLLDWTLYLKNESDPVQREILLGYLEKMGLQTFAANLTRISVEQLGLPYENAAFLYQKNDMKSYEVYRSLMRELFEAGEFGHDDGRMVLPKDSSVFGLISEFHLQMKRNYPDKSKHIGLWPALWVLTLTRFLHNNRVMHRASTVDVIHNARSRSMIRKKLRLFEE